MSAHVVVIDASFRRTTIKVNPSTHVSDILEEACSKFGLKASNYGLKHNNKQVDLSRSFRQTGLVSGAKLELVLASRSPSVVSVALQLPESYSRDVQGSRLIDKFPSTTTLWMVLRKFETSGTSNFNFTGRGVAQTDDGQSGAGRIYYETPVLHISGRQLSSFRDLQKTLSQLGLNSGSCLIRLNFQRTETPLEEAMTEIGQYFHSMEEPVAPGAHSGTPGNTESGAMSVTVPGELNAEKSSPMDTDPPESTKSSDNAAAVLTPTTPSEVSLPDEVIVGPNLRPITIFAAPSSHTPKAALDPYNDSDYEPTVAHAKLHQQSLQARSQNQRLLSDAELQRQAEEKAARQAAVKDVSIKVRFPDQLTVISSFTLIDSGSTLYDFVRGVIVAEDQPFTLVWTSSKGPKTIPNDPKARLIKDLGFAGPMLVNFNWEEGATAQARNGTTVKEQFASKAHELRIQEEATASRANEEEKGEEEKEETKKENELDKGGKKKGGVPKWLKLPGKK